MGRPLSLDGLRARDYRWPAVMIAAAVERATLRRPPPTRGHEDPLLVARCRWTGVGGSPHPRSWSAQSETTDAAFRQPPPPHAAQRQTAQPPPPPAAQRQTATRSQPAGAAKHAGATATTAVAAVRDAR